MLSEVVSEGDLTAIEHKVLTDLHVLEMAQGEWQFYVAGVLDMTNRIIDFLAYKENERQTFGGLGL